MENVHAVIQVQKDTKEIESVIRLKKILETTLVEKQNKLKLLDNTVTTLIKNLKSLEPTVTDQERLNNQFNAIIDNTLSKINTIIQDHQSMKIKFKELSGECNMMNLLTQQMIQRFHENSKDVKKNIALAKINLEDTMRLLSKQKIDFEIMKAQKQLEFTSATNKQSTMEESAQQLANQLNQVQMDKDAIHNEMVNEDITKERLQMLANSIKMEMIDAQKISSELNTFTNTLQNEFDVKQDMLKRKNDNRDNLQLKLQQLKENFVTQLNKHNTICEEEELPSHDVSLFLSDPGAYSMKLFQTIKDYITLKIQEQELVNCERDAKHCEVTDHEMELAKLLEQYQSIEKERETNTKTVEELKKFSSDYLNIQNEIPLKQEYLSQLNAENHDKKSRRLLQHEEMKQIIWQKQHDIREKGEEAKKAQDIVINSFKATIHGLRSKYEKYDKYFDNTKRKIAAKETPASSKRVKFNEVVYKREPSTDYSE